MKLAAHELHDLHELTMSCVNSITCMAMFKNIANDQELKSMLEKHFPAHIQDYNTKVECLNSTGASALPKLDVPNQMEGLTDFTKSPVGYYPPITPRTDVPQMNDREIATSYLLTLKRAGREYAWSAMEASNPDIREFLKDAFTMCCNHAYEVWQWMVQKGFYPLEPAPQNAKDTVANIYNPVPESALV